MGNEIHNLAHSSMTLREISFKNKVILTIHLLLIVFFFYDTHNALSHEVVK